MYKVFFNERVIYINSQSEHEQASIKVDANSEIPSLLVQFIDGDSDLYLSSEQPEQVWEAIKSQFNYLEAAGGIVENEDDELLFIYRLDFWDLPKGKIEKGESPEKAAYREIMEECGIQSHHLKKHLTNTYHIYQQNGEQFLKKTFWFLFQLEDNSEDVKPQTEEDIELVSWFGEDEIQLALLDSYESIREVYQKYQAL